MELLALNQTPREGIRPAYFYGLYLLQYAFGHRAPYRSVKNPIVHLTAMAYATFVEGDNTGSLGPLSYSRECMSYDKLHSPALHAASPNRSESEYLTNQLGCQI